MDYMNTLLNFKMEIQNMNTYHGLCKADELDDVLGYSIEQIFMNQK